MIERQGKMTVKIFTFGWSPEFVIRPLINRGVSGDDTILLVGSKPETDYAKKKVEDALRQVTTFLSMARATKVYYREIELGDDIVALCRTIIKMINDVSRPEGDLEFYLTGGMRVLIIATLIAAKLLFLAGRNVLIEVSREDSPESYRIPVQLLSLSPHITKSQLEVLRYLRASGEATFEGLAIGRSEITVRKHLTKLREVGLVTYITRGRKQVYKLTALGELLLDVLG